jgi:hypothetical protein
MLWVGMPWWWPRGMCGHWIARDDWDERVIRDCGTCERKKR